MQGMVFCLVLSIILTAFAESPQKLRRTFQFLPNHCDPFPVEYDAVILLSEVKSGNVIVLGVTADPILPSSRAHAVMWRIDSLQKVNDLMLEQSASVSHVDAIDDDRQKVFSLKTTKTSFQAVFEAFGNSFTWSPIGPKEFWISISEPDEFRIAVLSKQQLFQPIRDMQFVSIDDFARGEVKGGRPLKRD